MVNFTNFPDNYLFKIVKNELRTRQKFDYEGKNKYLIKIRTTDFRGLFYENDLPKSMIILNNTKIQEK